MPARRMTLYERSVLKDKLLSMAKGRADKTFDHMFNRKHIQQEFEEALRRQGFDTDTLAANLIELTKARINKYFTDHGLVTELRTVTDNGTRLGANALIGKYLGLDVQKVDLQHSGMIGNYNALELLSDGELEQLIKEEAESADSQ